jgi:hypothetical protein
VSIYRDVFGASKEDLWRQLSSEIGACYVEGGFWKGDRVQAWVGPWTVTLDTESEGSGASRRVHTRIRAPFVNRGHFRFLAYRTGVFSELGKLVGMQDVSIGFPEFDEIFIIKGSDEERLRKLFSNKKIRDLLHKQPNVRFEIVDLNHAEGQAPQDTDELRFQVNGAIQDIELLKQLFELFSVTLNQLCRMGVARGPCPMQSSEASDPSPK